MSKYEFILKLSSLTVSQGLTKNFTLKKRNFNFYVGLKPKALDKLTIKCNEHSQFVNTLKIKFQNKAMGLNIYPLFKSILRLHVSFIHHKLEIFLGKFQK